MPASKAMHDDVLVLQSSAQPAAYIAADICALSSAGSLPIATPPREAIHPRMKDWSRGALLIVDAVNRMRCLVSPPVTLDIGLDSEPDGC